MEQKHKFYTTILGAGVALFATVLATRGVHDSFIFHRAEADSNYHLLLNNNSDSRYSSGAEKTQFTSIANPIVFTYNSCSSNSNYHAVIGANGSIVNKTPMHGIEKNLPTFNTSSNGQLRFRASFDGTSWGEYATLTSGHIYDFNTDSAPNYIELSALNSPVSLTSIDFGYSCVEQDIAIPAYEKVTKTLSDYSGKYLIVNESNGIALNGSITSANTFNQKKNYVNVNIVDNKIVSNSVTESAFIELAKYNSGYSVKIQNGQYIDDYNSTSYNFYVSDNKYAATITVDNEGAHIFGSDGPEIRYCDNSSYDRFEYIPKSNSTRYQPAVLYKFNGLNGTIVPEYEAYFNIVDPKASNYVIGTAFDDFINSDGLNVSVVMSDGESKALSTSEYTHVIKDSNNQVVPSNVAFSNEGVYTVYINHGSLLEYSYQITVVSQAVNNDWELVTSETQLVVGNRYIIAHNSKGATAGEIGNSVMSKVSSSFSDDYSKITTVGEGTVELTLGGESDAWTFANSNGDLLGATAAKKLAWGSGTTTWEISIDSSNNATIFSTSTTYGRFLYNGNSGQERFTPYATSTSTSTTMLLPQLYTKAVSSATKVTSVSVTPTALTIVEGETGNLSVTVLPDNATNKTVTWTSDHPEIALVNNGTVTAVKEGTAVITATAKDGSGKKGTCTVKVNKLVIPLTGVEFNSDTASTYVGSSVTLTPKFTPTNATNQNVTWKSDDTNVATVINGVVTGVSAGTAHVTVTTQDGGFTATCTITVNNVSVTSVSLSESELILYTDDDPVTLTATILPTNATIKTLTWSVSPAGVVTVNNGIITPVGVGSAIITATANGGKTDTCSVEVKDSSEKPNTNTFTFSFYDSSTLSSTNGTAIDTNYVIGKMICSDSSVDPSNVLLSVQNSGNARYGMNGGLTFGTGNSSGSTKFTIANSYKVTKVEMIATTYDSSSYIVLDGNQGKGEMNSKQTILAECENTLVWENSSGWTTLEFGSNARRATVYTMICTYGDAGSGTETAKLEGISVSSPKTDYLVGDTFVKPDVTAYYTDNSTKLITNEAVFSGYDLHNQGTQTVNVSYTENSITETTSYSITVSPTVVPVESIVITPSSLSLAPGGSSNLTATVYPSNASDKQYTWSSNNNLITINSSGHVAASSSISSTTTATITVTSHYNNSIKGTCLVTVTVSGGGGGSGSSGLITSSLQIGDSVAIFANDASVELSEFPTGKTYGAGSSYDATHSGAIEFTVEEGSSNGTFSFKTSSDTYLAWSSGNSLILKSGKDTESSWKVTIASNGNATVLNGKDNNRQIWWNDQNTGKRFACYTGKTADKDYKTIQFFGLGAATSVPATSLSLDKTELELAPGAMEKLTVSFGPTGANSGKDVEWSSSNTSVVTVDQSGNISVNSNATAGKTATISVKLKSNNATASCRITVVEVQKDAWTILVYMCGADLESKSKLATSDINEMLAKKSSQPENVNIVIETGGASTNNTYFSTTNLKRYHIDKSGATLDSTLSYSNMSNGDTLESFVEYGLSKYPAEKVGLILWNHGGGMAGVCIDEVKKGDGLSAAAVCSAVSTAKSRTSTTGKLEFIGYDACLMSVADIASVNADYFNYMVASQESESGTGWDYDGWLPTLYGNINVSTPTLLDKICTTFISENGGNSSDNDQTLSVIDLNKMGDVVTAFNSYVNSTSITWKKVSDAYNASLTHFGGTGEDDCYGLADFNNYLTALQNKAGGNTSTIKQKISDAVLYNRYGGYYDSSTGYPCGLSLFVAYTPSSQYYLQLTESYYKGNNTKFTPWQTINLNGATDWYPG